ncbi:MAG: VanZ family protein [Alteromonadaceae bacterium]|nr:VanZ family protein [Alteromonadaceae bacterium]
MYGSLWPLPELPLPSNDKVHHIIGYFGLSFPLAIRRPPNTWMWCSAIVLLSAVIELLQPYVNRFGEWQDLGANCIGVAIALVLGLAITKWIPKPQTSECR